MIKLFLLLIVIILFFILVKLIVELNKKEEKENDEMIDENELAAIGARENVQDEEDNGMEHFTDFDISKEDYERIRNDNFNDQFFNFQKRLNGSSDNYDNSVDKINRFRNSKYGFTEENAMGMTLKDVSDYFINH